jgi:hypothetical protein
MGNDECIGQAYNITGDEWMTWNTYHEQVAEVCGGTFNPVYVPVTTLREVAPKASGGAWEIFAWPSIFSNDKIRRDAGYPGQTISWREGVKRNLDYLEASDKLKNSDTDDYEDRLAEAVRQSVAALPRQD